MRLLANVNISLLISDVRNGRMDTSKANIQKQGEMKMKAKKITNKMIAKTFKLKIDVSEVRFEVFSLISGWVNGTVDLNGEAKYVAAVLTGTNSTFGMQANIRHFSGLEPLVNKLTNEWEVKESPEGNGYSMYVIA